MAVNYRFRDTQGFEDREKERQPIFTVLTLCYAQHS